MIEKIEICTLEEKHSYYESLGFVLNEIQLYDEDHHGPLSMRIELDKYLEMISQ